MFIGKNEIRRGIFLAPMAGYTDRTFRALCEAHGCEFAVTEMVSAKGIHYKDKKTPLLAALCPGERAAVQIFGSEPDIIAEAARWVCALEPRPAALDINMGCPVKKIISNGEGSAMMKSPLLAGRIIEAAAKASELPVTVKLRTGWDNEHKNAPELARIAEESGAAAIFVHGRTREQLYTGESDLEMIAAVKSSVKIPVVGNGSLFSAADCLRMLKLTGCDGVMIARGALGNPWIFDELNAALDGGEFTPPSVDERLDTALAQLRGMIADKGEYTGIREARAHIFYYLKGMERSAAVRGELSHAETYEQVAALLNSLRVSNS